MSIVLEAVSYTHLRWLGFSDVVVRTERIQAPNILDKMISKENYFAMLKYAKAVSYTHLQIRIHFLKQCGMQKKNTD